MEDTRYKLMTPGPTRVAENVRMARSLACTNPDLDIEFFDFYKETCEQISFLLHTNNETLILSGEGILGLEAACAGLTEPGDRVLVIDNGLYGNGFKDFVSLYGGVPVLYTDDYHETIDVSRLEAFLSANHDFKYATVVHCDTPSGMLNDIGRICPLLKKYGILTVVDSVSAMFGEYVNVDKFQIDFLCGGSQKVVSAPAGLTFVTASPDAKAAMHTRKTPIASFYANITIFDDYYEKKWFPYTMPISDIYGLRTAFDNIQAEPDIISRHAAVASHVREVLSGAGYTFYQNSGFSNTVTVVNVPEGFTAEDILNTCKDNHNIMLAGSFGALAGTVIRIGHMGENARLEYVDEVLNILCGLLNNKRR
ncbi:MAG: alanine--glyoxylate aminotransferase family protein [Lachnospiraceae bacterium]|nr:alanine--glyoxylate aminotransferase family protein [Lachnospiraceae bacterium]